MIDYKLNDYNGDEFIVFCDTEEGGICIQGKRLHPERKCDEIHIDPYALDDFIRALQLAQEDCWQDESKEATDND